MKITRVALAMSGLVVCVSTSHSTSREWHELHRLLRSRGAPSSAKYIDLLFVVADASDATWHRRTWRLCRDARLAIVQPIIRAELGAGQFPFGMTACISWMLRYFDAAITTDEPPLEVLRHLLDFVAPGYVGTDFADLYACLAHCRIASFDRFECELFRGESEPDEATYTGDVPSALASSSARAAVVAHSSDPLACVDMVGRNAARNGLEMWVMQSHWISAGGKAHIGVMSTSVALNGARTGQRERPTRNSLQLLTSNGLRP